MNKPIIPALLVSAVLLSGCSGLQAAPVDAKAQTTSKGLGESYTWYDGDRPRQVWVDPQLIAEFPGQGGQARANVRSVAPQARELPSPQRGVKLWEVEQGADQTLRSLRAAQAGGRFSPVLRDAPGEGRMRALPGNVVVYLDRRISDPEAWLESHQLELVRALEFAPNAYLVRSEPGLASLELANRLRESAGVVAAMPEWWQEVAPR